MGFKNRLSMAAARRQGMTELGGKTPLPRGQYHILGPRRPDDEPNYRYPSVDERLMPISQPSDGYSWASGDEYPKERWRKDRFPVGLYEWWWQKDSKGTRVYKSPRPESGEVRLTDHRIVLWFNGVPHESAWVGHIYYPWLRAVAFDPEDEKLRFMTTTQFTDGEKVNWFVDVWLDGGDPKEAVARIIEHATAWWLANLAEDKPEREKFKALLDLDHSAAEPGKWTVVSMPLWRSPGENTFGDTHVV